MSGNSNDNAGAELILSAVRDGRVSMASAQALLDAGATPELTRALGDDGSGGEVLLVTLLVDDTASIGDCAVEVIDGHNRLLEALAEPLTTEVLVQTRAITAGLISPYRQLARAARLDTTNYQAVGEHTPLYREAIITLGSVMAKTAEQDARGRRVRTFTMLLTDGIDNASGDITAEEVQHLVVDLVEVRGSGRHIVGGLGVGKPEIFKGVFAAMGIRPQWVLTASSDADAIRDMFLRVRVGLLSAAASEGRFRQLASGSLDPDS